MSPKEVCIKLNKEFIDTTTGSSINMQQLPDLLTFSVKCCPANTAAAATGKKVEYCLHEATTAASFKKKKGLLTIRIDYSSV